MVPFFPDLPQYLLFKKHIYSTVHTCYFAVAVVVLPSELRPADNICVTSTVALKAYIITERPEAAGIESGLRDVWGRRLRE